MDLSRLGLPLIVTPIALISPTPIEAITSLKTIETAIKPKVDANRVQCPCPQWPNWWQEALVCASKAINAAVNHQNAPSLSTPELFSELLLQTDGILELGDFVTFQDGSLYDEYYIDGEAGQSILIILESDEFDPYLVLLNARGDIIALNDDVTAENTNSRLLIALPENDVYRVVASGFRRNSRGKYRLTIWTEPKE